MKKDHIVAGKIYSNNSKSRLIHRLVTGVTDYTVYFTVVHSKYTSGINAVGTKDWSGISNFQKWAKSIV